jgi:hypothetical protein
VPKIRQKSKNRNQHSHVDPIARIQRIARHRADEQAKRIPWQRLLETRNEYIDWQEFYLWVRSILETEGRIPNFLLETLNLRCPGFLDSEKELSSGAPDARSVALRLESWVDNHIFDFAKRDGWFHAITYYAVREPRYQRAEVCWAESVAEWKRARPLRYPTFEEWEALAAACDETAHLLSSLRKTMASGRKVAPSRLEETISHYLDWEAFAYWARRGIEAGPPLPNEVKRELRQRCSGLIESGEPLKSWEQLMTWIVDQHFAEAKGEGWFDTVLTSARMHPRAIRTMEYADHCEDVWAPGQPVPYPSFEQWRCEADAYVEPPAADLNPES